MSEPAAAQQRSQSEEVFQRALTVLRWIWPAVLALWLYQSYAGLGYNPTDDGFVLAQSYRLLHFEVPHVDFISARPVGSGILHMLDVLAPTPLEATSRLVTIVEMVAAALFLGAITFNRWPVRWALWEIIGVIAATLVNFHVFPIMAWHTVDGIAFTAAGFAVLLVGNAPPTSRRAVVGMLLLGIAATMKQSFFAAPALGLLYLAVNHPAPWRARLQWLLRPLLAGIAPGVLYVVWVTLAGGFGAMREQLTGGKSTAGEALFTTFEAPLDARRLIQHLAAAFFLLTAATLATRTKSLPGTITAIALRGWLTALVVDTVRHEGLRLAGTWGHELLWTLLAVLAWELWAYRSFDTAAFMVAAVAFMASLSWGYAVPNLVAGSLALLIIARIWRDGLRLPAFTDPAPILVPIVVALLIFGTVQRDFRSARNRWVYRDSPKPALTADLGTITSGLDGIKTNAGTYAYLQQLDACVNAHPASRVALLPNNPGLYPLLNVRNPFPMDWGFYDELVGDAEERMVKAARKLNERGDYLAVFETEGFSGDLIAGRAVPPEIPADTPIFHYSKSGRDIYDVLDGRRINCGIFKAIYQPVRRK